MALTMESVLALAPDEASAKAARGMTAPAKWPTLGADEHSVWGECQGSGAKPYQTSADLSGPAFRCSCPSRKFPCKHGLALLLIQVQHPDLFSGKARPEWVAEWLASRTAKEQKKEERQAVAAAQPVDPVAAQKRQSQRWTRMTEAAQELLQWLSDQLARGIGNLNPEALKQWHVMAARMVDAQVPGLGQRIRDAAQLVNQGEDWAERLLRRLGLLYLVCEAASRRDSLEADLQAELRMVLGWPYDKAEVLEQGASLRDRWQVLGVAQQEREDKLTERRVWLQGQDSGWRALLLDHAHGGRGFEQAWLTGAVFDATLAFFPGSGKLRALCVDRTEAPAGVLPQSGWAAEWQAVAERVAASPWVPLHPLVMRQAVPVTLGDRMHLVSDGQMLPAVIGSPDAWRLLAISGGHPVSVMGEWDGEGFQPLTAWQPGEASVLWQRLAS